MATKVQSIRADESVFKRALKHAKNQKITRNKFMADAVIEKMNSLDEERRELRNKAKRILRNKGE